jgi:hypothetical protein
MPLLGTCYCFLEVGIVDKKPEVEQFDREASQSE